MALNASALFAAVTSKAAAIGVFDRVADHEPANAPGTGLTCAAWADLLRPIAKRSGLSSTSGLLTITLRIYRQASGVEDGSLDPAVLDAADQLIGALIGDLDLGEAAEVDVLGAHSPGLTGKAAWLKPDEGPAYRVLDVSVPIVVDNLWPQAR